MSVPQKRLSDGILIPILGLGTWQMTPEVCKKAIPLAWNIGYRHIDTAFAYSNEEAIGAAIAPFPRSELFLTSKLWRDFHDPKKVEALCDTSLKSLKTSYLDLYLMHWPERKNMVEILGAMMRLKEKGKVKSVGVCNATISHLEELLRQKVPPSMNQVEFHPFLNQKELLAFCNQNQIAITAYCPIARGAVCASELLISIAKRQRKTAAQVALRWLLQKGMVAVPKGSSKRHLEENFALLDFELSESEMDQIDQLHQNRRCVSPVFNEFSS